MFLSFSLYTLSQRNNNLYYSIDIVYSEYNGNVEAANKINETTEPEQKFSAFYTVLGIIRSSVLKCKILVNF